MPRMVRLFSIWLPLLLAAPDMHGADLVPASSSVPTNTSSVQSANRTSLAGLIELEKKAAAGDPEAQFETGKRYADGIGVKTNFTQGFVWLSKSAKQGNIEAQRRVGEMLVDGIGTEADVDQGLKWLVTAANGSDVQAQLDLNKLYFQGLAVMQDYAQAFHWASLAAQQGNAIAQGKLGTMYLLGQGVAKEAKAGRMWLEKAAAQNEAEAMYNLGSMYLSGFGAPPDPEQAFDWSLRSAEAGCVEAQSRVGTMYWMGVGTKQDHDKAIQWLDQAALKGNAAAQYYLGSFYTFGVEGLNDLPRGLELLHAAAKSGHPVAQASLGTLLLSGRIGGVPDFRKVYVWMSAAATQGNAQAQYNLGLMYKEGAGVPIDRVEELKWLHLSAGQGNRLAAAQRDVDSVFLSAEQRQEARCRADAFKPINDRPLMADDIEPATVHLDDNFIIQAEAFGRPVSLAVDTGTDVLMLDAEFKGRLGKPVETVHVAALSRKALTLGQYRAPDLFVGGKKLSPDACVVDQFKQISAALETPLNGVLGVNCFDKYVITFDPDEHQFSISGSVPESVRRNGQVIPLQFALGHLFLEAHLKEGASFPLRIDSGDNGASISLSEQDWHRIFPNGLTNSMTNHFLGIGGQVVTGGYARIPSLIIGTNVYANMIGKTVSNSPQSSTLGQGFIRRHVFTIDYPNKLLYLLPGKHFGDADDFDMSGLTLERNGSEIVVQAVTKDSPAYLGGVRQGDHIVSINDKETASLNIYFIESVLRKEPGAEVSVEVLRAGESHHFIFRLKRMF